MVVALEGEAEGDAGWTHVVNPRRKGRSRPKPSVQPFNGPPPIATDLTLAMIRKDFTLKTTAWKSSDCRRRVLEILARHRPAHGWQLTTAICLASGSFSRDNWECRRRSMWQMAVFADLRDHLASECPIVPLSTVAQEPAFTPLDKQFLQSLQVTELDVPATKAGDTATGLGPARAHCSPSTFLYEPFMDMDTQAISELVSSDMVLYIGSSMRGRIDRTSVSSRSVDDKKSNLRAKAMREEELLAEQFQKKYHATRFPAFEIEPNVLEGLYIYVRASPDECTEPD